MTQDWAVRGNEIAKKVAQNAQITGSEKQIIWAKDIIQRAAFVVSTAVFKTAEMDQAEPFLQWVLTSSKVRTTARWWIDNRDRGCTFWENIRYEWEDIMEEA